MSKYEVTERTPKGLEKITVSCEEHILKRQQQRGLIISYRKLPEENNGGQA